MKHRLTFLIGIFLTIPLLPIIAYQGKRIRKTIPKLPEASEPSGYADFGFSSTMNVLFLGESTVAGVGVNSHENGFAGATARELARLYQKNIKWKVVARSGYTVRMIRQKLLRNIGDFTPNLIIVGIGANDAFTLSSPWKWRYQVSKLIRALQIVYTNVPIAFTNMPPIKEFPAFTRTIKFTIGNLVEILGAELAFLVPTFKQVIYASEIIEVRDWAHILSDSEDTSAFFSDGVHPSKLTYQTWGREFGRFIFRSDLTL